MHSPKSNSRITCRLNLFCSFVCLFVWRDSPHWVGASSFTRFLDHTQRHSTVGSTPLDEWTARRRDLYLTTHNTHNRQTSMPPVGFEPTISVGERPQTNALNRAATGAGRLNILHYPVDDKSFGRPIDGTWRPTVNTLFYQEHFAKRTNYLNTWHPVECTANCIKLQQDFNTVEIYVYWTLHNCDSWRIRDQLDVTIH